MLKYKLYQDNRSNAQHKGNWYAHMNLDGTMGLDELAAHMSDHGTPYSKGVICGVLNDMVGCIKELVLEGNAVKLDNLAIFSCGIRNRQGAASEEEFTVANIAGVKLRARATGTLSNSNLNLAATLRKATTYVGKTSSTGTAGGNDSPTTPPTDNNEGGSDSAGGSEYE